MYILEKQEGRARLGRFETPHGVIHTPVFMNVATQGAIKGGLSAWDLENIETQVMLCNTYHLHLRPGDETVKALGGIRRMTTWDGPVLTDSGGFQVFSLAQLRKLTEEGAEFASHLDGHRVFMSPEKSIQIQSNLGSTIAMALDECMENPSPYDYAKKSVERTTRWLARCRAEMDRLNSLEGTLNPRQMLFGINQGCCYKDLRIDHMKAISEIDCEGYAIGGLAVGETVEEMYETIEAVEEYMPKDKPRYLMGVGTPSNIIESVARGVDFFDCVMPTRNGRHGHLFTKAGIININNKKYELDESPIDPECSCPVCRRYTRAYLHHLYKAGEILGMRFGAMHNLYFYNNLVKEIREALSEGRFEEYRKQYSSQMAQRI